MTTKSLSNLTNETLIHSSNDGPTNTNVSSLSFQNSQYKFTIKVLIIINFTVVISFQQQNGDIERLSLTKTQYSFEGTKCLLLVHLSCFSRAAFIKDVINFSGFLTPLPLCHLTSIFERPPLKKTSIFGIPLPL